MGQGRLPYQLIQKVTMDSSPEEGGFRAGIETGPDGKSTGSIICYPTFNPNCKVVTLPQPGNVDSTGFLSLSEPTPYHDEALIRATVEINKIVAKLEPHRGSSKGHLHVVFGRDGPMLVWVRAMVMPLDDIAKPANQ